MLLSIPNTFRTFYDHVPSIANPFPHSPRFSENFANLLQFRCEIFAKNLAKPRQPSEHLGFFVPSYFLISLLQLLMLLYFSILELATFHFTYLYLILSGFLFSFY